MECRDQVFKVPQLLFPYGCLLDLLPRHWKPFYLDIHLSLTLTRNDEYHLVLLSGFLGILFVFLKYFQSLSLLTHSHPRTHIFQILEVPTRNYPPLDSHSFSTKFFPIITIDPLILFFDSLFVQEPRFINHKRETPWCKVIRVTVYGSFMRSKATKTVNCKSKQSRKNTYVLENLNTLLRFWYH